MANKYLIHGAPYKGDGTTSSEAVGSVVTITIASPGVVSWTAHGLAADTPVYFSTTGALPTGLVAGTKYYVRNPAADTFEISATAGGASINTSGTQSGTHTVSGAGAWNDINIFTGTAPTSGTVDAGDTVFIRSKSSAGADLSITATGSVSIGKSGLTGTQGVRWVLDAGTVWSGISGILTCQATAAAGVFSILLRNVVHADVHGNIIFLGFAGTAGTNLLALGLQSEASNCKIDTTPNTADGSRIFLATSTLRNPIIKSKTRLTYLFNIYEYSHARVINPDIELTSATELDPLFIFNTASILEVFGGRLYGAGVTAGVVLCGPVSAGAGGRFYGFAYPVDIAIANLNTGFDGSAETGFHTAIGADGLLGAEYADYFGLISSRRDGNYPTLNATLPDSVATPWSYILDPLRAQAGRPMIVNIHKMYSSAASAITATLELLVSDVFAEIDKSTCWFELQYIDDTTGLPVFMTSVDFAGGALSSSTAAWTSTTYGTVTFTKHKITLTTPSTVRQNTMVQARLSVATPQVSAASDRLILCPDIQVVAV